MCLFRFRGLIFILPYPLFSKGIQLTCFTLGILIISASSHDFPPLSRQFQHFNSLRHPNHLLISKICHCSIVDLIPRLKQIHESRVEEARMNCDTLNTLWRDEAPAQPSGKQPEGDRICQLDECGFSSDNDGDGKMAVVRYTRWQQCEIVR